MSRPIPQAGEVWDHPKRRARRVLAIVYSRTIDVPLVVWEDCQGSCERGVIELSGWYRRGWYRSSE